MNQDLWDARNACQAVVTAIDTPSKVCEAPPLGMDAIRAIRRLLNEEAWHKAIEQPEPGGEDNAESDHFCRRLGDIGALKAQLAELADQLENCTGVVSEHYSQLSELKEKHDLRLKYLGSRVVSHEETLGGATKDLADLTERLDRTLRSLAVKQPLPKPSGEDEDRETDIVGIFRRLGQVETNYRIKFPELAKRMGAVETWCGNLDQRRNELADHIKKQLANLAERVEAIDSEHCDMRSQIRIMALRLDALSPAPAPAPKPRPACEHCQCSGRTYVVAFDGSMTARTCDDPECHAVFLSGTWYYPGCLREKPKVACEHLCTERIVRSVMGGRVAIAACVESRCPAIRVGGVWYIPQPPSEKDDGEGKQD